MDWVKALAFKGRTNEYCLVLLFVVLSLPEVDVWLMVMLSGWLQG